MRLVIGKARSGKTACVIQEIQQAVQNGTGKSLLIVPEQYTHEAERELCEACGDRMSLFAEVMSFSGLARWNMMQNGGLARLRLDDGGKILCAATALKELQPGLQIYSRAADRPDFINLILQELKTLKTAAVESQQLRNLAKEVDVPLAGKLLELALILDAYEAVMERSGADSEEPLALLSEQIEQGGLGEFERVYIDGFVDFTGLEQAVLKAMIRRGLDLTVCLTLDGPDKNTEYHLPSRIALAALQKAAEDSGASVQTVRVENQREENAIGYFAEHMFDYAAEPWSGTQHEIRLNEAANPRAECELAAAEILRAVREDGCRWRDIAVAVRGFEDYRGTLESTFRRYEIPLFLTKKDPLAEKPLPLWIECAYDIVLGNWDVDDVTAWLYCGFSGLSEEDCDALCGYIYKWQLKKSAWLRPEPWRQHPDGYGKPWTDSASERLNRVNAARRKIAEPLLAFRMRTELAANAAEQADALAALLKEAELPLRLAERAECLEREGKQELAAEYRQLWELCSNAVRQMAAMPTELSMDTRTFRELFHTVLEQYDIGLIPVALDRVSAGDFDRMRRRNIRRLIVLGCNEERMPAAGKSTGIFTADERDTLAGHDLMIGGGDAELWREYALIYHTLSLPHEQLVLYRPVTDFEGNITVSAGVYSAAKRLFCLCPERPDVLHARLSAESPALTLAASAPLPGSGTDEYTAWTWFQANQPRRLERLLCQADRKRDSLSRPAVEALYGKQIRISPSRLETFSDCRFRFYCDYGLKAEENIPAAFRAPEIGTFVHAILESTAKEVQARGGFSHVSDAELRTITNEAIESYIREELNNFEEKTPRFRHLFRRICSDVYQIVLDTAQEMRRSDFTPLSFELNVSDLAPSLCREASLRLTGIADRIDGWQSEGRLYLRVVDYKTGRKKFSLSDVWYGRNLQMLLYLYTVSDNAELLYGLPGSPAGILYLPAREELLHFDSRPDEAGVEKQRRQTKRRSGLVLDDPMLIESWEHADGKERVYLPEKTGADNPMVSEKQLALLRRHVSAVLNNMSASLRDGSIDANPSYQSESDNACRLCPYHSICHFNDGENGDAFRPLPKISDEAFWENLQGGREE